VPFLINVEVFIIRKSENFSRQVGLIDTLAKGLFCICSTLGQPIELFSGKLVLRGFDKQFTKPWIQALYFLRPKPIFARNIHLSDRQGIALKLQYARFC